jgi:hypothetical protein
MAVHSCSGRLIQGLGVTRTLAACFVDRRDPALVDHSVRELRAQRIYALDADCLVDVELRFAQQYLAIRAGRYDRVRIWSRKRDHVQVGYRIEEAVAACEAAGVVPSL